jgi:para-nitrobenzyl esterase
MRQRTRLSVCLVVALLSCLASCNSAPPAVEEKPSPVLMAGGERLIGLQLGPEVEGFLGVPYAAAPTGDQRWRPAAAHKPRPGEVDATRYGPACPQSQGNPDWYRMVAEGFGRDPSVIPDLTHMDEDCLYLNIWMPTRGSGELLPVMIWVHGGSNVNGWAYEPNYVGAALAARGVVVVSINYRMGVFGFLPIPFAASSDIPSGNYGISDIIAATRWVKENAAAFGGDPGNMTLFGESAGAANIYALMKSPQAEGLFRRAILQSGALGPADMPTLQLAQARSQTMFERAGIDSMDAARALAWQDLVDLHKTTGVDHYHGPVLDGYWVQGAEDVNPGIDVLVGSNLNEMLMYIDGPDEDVLSQGLADFPENVWASLLALPMFEGRTPLETSDILSTASQFHCPSERIADIAAMQGQGSYLYRFTRKRAGADAYGAYHGAEIPYVFDTHDDWLPTHAEDRALTEIMMQYWVAFARTGNPNQAGLPDWPRHIPGDDNVQELGERVGATKDFMAPLCAALTGGAQ